MGNLYDSSLLLLTIILSLDAVAMLSVKKKLFRAITSPFFWHLPENSIFGHFWPFFTICACSWATAWSHLRFYWHNYYYWVLLQWYLRSESYSRLLPLHFPTICLKIEFLVILIIFLTFLHPSYCMCVLLYLHLFIHLFIHPSCLQLSKTAKIANMGQEDIVDG